MAIVKSRPNISLAEFANTYVSFGILMVVALFAAELTQNLTLYRANYSFLVSTALVIPSLCLYVLSQESSTKRNYWLLFWTFGFLAYLVYGFYQFLGMSNGIPGTFATSGYITIASQVLLALWWVLDTALGWLSNSQATWIKVQRLGATIYIGLNFLIISLMQPYELAFWLGIILAIAIVLCLLVRVTNSKLEVSHSPQTKKMSFN